MAFTMNESDYQDAMDLTQYASDHTNRLRNVLGPAMDGAEIDTATAEISCAIRRLKQLETLLFEKGGVQ